ncbi:MAG: hypothetical protein J6N95_03310 [Bacilli bacterium]|nr:hypothetical protein [Bacilli bacterium]
MKNKRLLFGLLNIIFISVTGCTNNEQQRTLSSSSSVLSVESIPSSLSQESIQDIYYHVSFINDDETLLYETDVLKGDTATYVGVTPTKEEDDEFKYEFIGWDQPLNNINMDLVTKALYKSIAKENWGPVIWF